MARLVQKGIASIADWLGDRVTDYTGLAAVRVPLQRDCGPRAQTLPVPGYVQTNSYACGAIAAASVVRYFRPEIEFGTVWEAVDPEPELGAGIRQVARALRSFGLRVMHKRQLRFADLCRAIDAGCPVLTVIRNPGADCQHWVAVYGYRRIPDAVYIANNGLPFFTSNRVSKSAFEKLRDPKGNGRICRAGISPIGRPNGHSRSK